MEILADVVFGIAILACICALYLRLQEEIKKEIKKD